MTKAGGVYECTLPSSAQTFAALPSAAGRTFPTNNSAWVWESVPLLPSTKRIPLHPLLLTLKHQIQTKTVSARQHFLAKVLL